MTSTTDKPAETEPKPRPVKRPAKPRMAYHVPRGIAWLDDDGETARVRAGKDVEEGRIPADLIDAYLERGDIIALPTTTRKAD